MTATATLLRSHGFDDDVARKLDDGTPASTGPDVFPIMWPAGADRIR